jgi:hypothetical protein
MEKKEIIKKLKEGKNPFEVLAEILSKVLKKKHEKGRKK